jgi:hypothetical protein
MRGIEAASGITGKRNAMLSSDALVFVSLVDNCFQAS